jgi:sortase A
MRVSIPREPLATIVRWTRRALFGGAALVLAYCGWVVSDSWVYQRARGLEFDSPVLAAVAIPAAARRAPEVFADGLIGRLEIPRLELTTMVMEGTGRTTLRRAAGHIAGTALPGQTGNVGISGHRDTFFRPLRNIRSGDAVALTTRNGAFNYRVVSTRIVKPSDVSVLETGDGEAVTLVTCYPFYFVGPAPFRFIVRAERVR